MNPRQILALRSFTSAVKELGAAGVTRSHRYLGDIAEFLCADAFGINLAKNLREVGYDGHREQIKVQIKYNGSKKTNVDLGNPLHYQEVYIVLGPESVVRPIFHLAEFLVYRFTSDEVMHMRTAKGKYSCAKGQLPSAPLKAIHIEDAAAIPFLSVD
jgi:hypothetical protein